MLDEKIIQTIKSIGLLLKGTNYRIRVGRKRDIEVGSIATIRLSETPEYLVASLESKNGELVARKYDITPLPQEIIKALEISGLNNVEV